MSAASVMVVGADRGIAHALTLQLASRGDRVLAVCLGEVSPYGAPGIDFIGRIDVTCDAAVQSLTRQLRQRNAQLDWIVHVAGVLGLDTLGKIDYAEMRRQFEINTLGPLRVVEACLPFLSAGSKVGVVTSRVGSLSDNGSGGMYAYRVSKAGANMVVLNLHHDLKSRGIAVMALHPGMVATDLTKDLPGNLDYIQPEAAARGLIAQMDGLILENAGQFRHANGERLSW